MNTETQIEELDISIRAYNGCKSNNLQTIGDLVQALRTGRELRYGIGAKTVKELAQVLTDAGFPVTVPEKAKRTEKKKTLRTPEMTEAQRQIDLLRDERDAEIEKIRSTFAAKIDVYQQQLDALREAQDWIDLREQVTRYEDAEGTVRYCKGCGARLMFASFDNVVNRLKSWGYSDRGVKERILATLRRISKKNYCCVPCEGRGVGGVKHDNRCLCE